MSIKYNERGEVVSVNGLTTGHHIGKPMQDAIAERPEDNEVYATQRNTITNCANTVVDEQPKPTGGASSWNDLKDKPFGEVTETDVEIFRKSLLVSGSTVGTYGSTSITAIPPLVVGDVYKFTIFKVTYEGVCSADGNGYRITSNEDASVYIRFITVMGATIYVYCPDTGNANVIVYKKERTESVLAEKYLPESVEGVVIRSSTEGSTKKFKLTVDDSGAVTATEV